MICLTELFRDGRDGCGDRVWGRCWHGCRMGLGIQEGSSYVKMQRERISDEKQGRLGNG